MNIPPAPHSVKSPQQLALFATATEGVTTRKESRPPNRSPSWSKRNDPRTFRVVTLPIERLLKDWDHIRVALRDLYPQRTGWGWVEMTMGMLRLASFYEACYPSANHVTAVTMPVGRQLSRRTFWRMVSWMEKEGLLTRYRGLRHDGFWSSNDYNLGPLMKLLLDLLNHCRNYQWGLGDWLGSLDGTAWLKVGSMWVRVKEWLAGGGPRWPSDVLRELERNRGVPVYVKAEHRPY